jgi:GNAT superfamily N-acetyltransferase
VSELTFRLATLEDVPVLQALIARSARALARGDYSEAQIEAALDNAWGVDTLLIRDGSYFVVESPGAIVACGGWSFRKTLFGADAYAQRVPEALDPGRDAARIRAFFVDPAWSRQGIARQLLVRCERAARAGGFASAELVATLPGERFYRAHGYVSDAPRAYPLTAALEITFVPMRRVFAAGEE